MDVRMVTEPVPGQENEDAVIHSGNLVGVLDGVTRPSGLDTGCRHSVAWYARTLAANVAVGPSSATLTEILADAITVTRSAHGGECDLTNPSTPAATVALIRKSGAFLEYLVLCDAFLVVDDGREVTVITDPRFERVIGDIRSAYLLGDSGYDSPEHAARFKQAALEKQRLTNTEAGYWIAAAEPSAAHRAVTGRLPLDRIRRVALLTDGASRAVDLFGLFTWPEVLDLIEESGPEELIKRVREAELGDGARPRFKRHDDATVALCIP